MIDEKLIEDIRTTWESWKAASNKLRRIKTNRPFNAMTVSSVYGALTAIGLPKDVKLFVIVYIFTPEVLVGVRMRPGYRDFISSLFGYKTSCAVSIRMKSLMFTYKNYKNFRAEADKGVSVAEKVLQCLKK